MGNDLIAAARAVTVRYQEDDYLPNVMADLARALAALPADACVCSAALLSEAAAIIEDQAGRYRVNRSDQKTAGMHDFASRLRAAMEGGK